MMNENKYKEKFENLEIRYNALLKEYYQLKQLKEALYHKQQELIKEHKSLIDKYFRECGR
jgi:hypothetical protein